MKILILIYPPIANMTRVSQGIAPSMSLHRVAAEIKFSLSKFDCLNIGNPNHYKMYHTKFFKRHRNIHCWRIDKSEKENIGSKLLVRVKFWLPVIIIRMESNRNIILIVKFHNIGPFLYIFRYKCSQGFIKRS